MNQLNLSQLLAIIVMVSCLDEKDDSPLFEAKPAGRERSYRRLAIGSTVLGILLILVYRWTHIPTAGKFERFVWIGMFVSEIWFGFYYLLTQACRWSPLYYSTFKDRLSRRYGTPLATLFLIFFFNNKYFIHINNKLIYTKQYVRLSNCVRYLTPMAF